MTVAQTPKPKAKHFLRNVLLSLVGLVVFLCLVLLGVAYLGEQTPQFKSTTTARAALAASQQVALLWTATPSPTPLPSDTSTVTATPPPPTDTATATATLPSATGTAMARSASGSATAAGRAAAVGATGTAKVNAANAAVEARTATALFRQTATAEWAGASPWFTYRDRTIGVTKAGWSHSIGFFGSHSGKIFISLYIIAKNVGDHTLSFNPDDFGVIDGGGEVSGRALGPEKDPPFSSCQVLVGGACEGWWTTEIWERPAVMGSITLQWNPGSLLDSTQQISVTVPLP